MDDEKDKTRIHIDGVDFSSMIGKVKVFDKATMDKLMREYQEELRKYVPPQAGSSPIHHESADLNSGGLVGSSIFGSSQSFRNAFGGFDASKVISQMLDVSAEEAAKMVNELKGNTVSSLLWKTAMEVWDYPSGIRFTVWRQEEQASTLLTVEYLDPAEEADEPLVKSTVEFTDEALERDPELTVERGLEKLKDNCDADIAAFEPDGEEEGA
jgi:hypothetical protein